MLLLIILIWGCLLGWSNTWLALATTLIYFRLVITEKGK